MLIPKVCQKCGKSFEADPWADDLDVCRDCLGGEHFQEDEVADAVEVEVDANNKAGPDEGAISGTQGRVQSANDRESSTSKVRESIDNNSGRKKSRPGKGHSWSKTVFDNAARINASHWWQAGQRRKILGVLDTIASSISAVGSFVFSLIMLVVSWKDASILFLPISASFFAAGLLYLRSIAPLRQTHFDAPANNFAPNIGNTIHRVLHSCSNLLDRLLRVRAFRIPMLILRAFAAGCAAFFIIVWLWTPSTRSAWWLLLPCYFCFTSFREIWITASYWRKRREWIIANPGSRATRYIMVIGTVCCTLILIPFHASRLSSEQERQMATKQEKSKQAAETSTKNTTKPPGVTNSSRRGSLESTLAQTKQDFLNLHERLDKLYRELREKGTQARTLGTPNGERIKKEAQELEDRIKQTTQEMERKREQISTLKKDIQRERIELKLAEYNKRRQSWVGKIPVAGKSSTGGNNGLFDDALSRLENNQKIGEDLFAIIADYPSNVIRITQPDKPEYDNSKGNVVLDVEFAVDHARYNSFIQQLSSLLTQHCGEPVIIYVNDTLYDDIDNDGITANLRLSDMVEIGEFQHVGLHDFVRQNAKTKGRRILLCTVVDNDKKGAYWEVYTVHQDIANVLDGKMGTPVLAAELYDSRRRVVGCDFFTMYTPLEMHSNRRSASPYLRINTKIQPTLLELDRGLIFTCFPSFHSSDLTQDIVRQQVTVPFDIKELGGVQEIKVHYRVPFKLVGMRRRTPKVGEWIYITAKDHWGGEGSKHLFVVTAIDGPEQDPTVTFTRTFAPTHSAPGAHETYKNKLSEISLLTPGSEMIVWAGTDDEGIVAGIAIPAPVAGKNQVVDGTVIYYKDGARIERSDAIPFNGLSFASNKSQSFQLYDCGFSNPPDILKN